MKHNPFPIKQINVLNLKFDEHGSAYSNNFEDIYFQPGIGLDEKRHVFLKGNHLPQNWHDKELFTIAETGFGTGLNFLATLKLWNQNREPNQQLHFISCELMPLNLTQLCQALKAFPEIRQYAQTLVEKYPEFLIYGTHRIHFSEFNVTLTLIFGDCVDAFENLTVNIDAWYLDGFAPSKNPDMWNQSLFSAISNLSHTGTTLATYTVAGKIRQGLTEAGFGITKVKGFGQKREMLTAKLLTENKVISKQPWAQSFKSKQSKSYTVIGAGIAGLSIAHKLQEQGKNVTLIDRQEYPCLETSGNPQAMIMPSFTLNDSVEARFYLSAFLYAYRYYSSEFYHSVGVSELAYSDKQKHWQEQFFNKFDLPDGLIHRTQEGLLYPQAGWLDTQGHAKNLFNQVPNYKQHEITKIERVDDFWHLYENNTVVHKTEVLVLANGININKLLNDYELPITAKHGEISYFKSKDISHKIADNLHVQLCKGYITPSWDGTQTIGATFDPINPEHWYKKPATSNNHWQRNTELWNNTPYESLLKKNISVQSRAGIRVTTPDHLPICGAVINQEQFKKDYNDIRHGKHWKQYPLPQVIENLYMMTGLGSRGFTSAPLLAESFVNQILGNPQVLNKQMLQNINPNRFLFKSLKKK